MKKTDVLEFLTEAKNTAKQPKAFETVYEELRSPDWPKYTRGSTRQQCITCMEGNLLGSFYLSIPPAQRFSSDWYAQAELLITNVLGYGKKCW